MLVTEVGPAGHKRRVMCDAEGAKAAPDVRRKSKAASVSNSLRIAGGRMFASLFLPLGYPESVAPEYATFQAWDTVQASCSYLRGILATQAIFEGVGVGRETATALAATLQWVVRDGASMLGGLLFTWWGAQSFDCDVKVWRLFADVINDVGLTLEMLSPLCGKAFLPVACLGSICKTMCGVAAGATRTALTAHFATAGNLADVAAKEGSQETAVTLFGLLA